MSKYWLCPTSEENYKLTKKYNVIGVTPRKRKSLDKLQIGDMITFYISKETTERTSKPVRVIKGIAEVTSDTYIDNKEIWKPMKGNHFPYRKKIKFIKDNVAIPVKEVIYELSYVKKLSKPQYWALPFKTGNIELTAEDWELVKSKFNNKDTSYNK
ncbi:MAG: EVE domain-containing protein [bacterium]